MEPERETPNSSGASPGGLREYKVVMLGAGGVGKSGKDGSTGTNLFFIDATTMECSPGGTKYCLIVFAMTMQFISHRFPDYHDPTIEDAYKTQVRIDDEPAYLDILDTAGQAEFTAMRDQYMRGGEGFIICYSITDRQSFQEAAEFKDLIYRVRHTYDIPLVLVGNKIDLKEFRQFHLVSEEEVANIQHQDQKGHLVVILIRATLTACLGVTPLAIQLRTSKENQKKIYNIIEELQVSREEGMNLAREYSCPFFETSAALHFYIDDVFHRLVREIRKREKSVPLPDRRLKSKDSLWQKLKGSLKKRKENPS